jgi:hypothetical protein
VLHTWSRTLTYHPHVHLLVTAGGLSADGSAWFKPVHARFLVPGFMLSQIFRAKLRDALRKAGLSAALDSAVWNRRWVVHVQSIGHGEHAALYLSRYVHRVALCNDRIERFQNGQVTFRYTHARTHDTRRMTLPVDHFLDRFMLHVLPRGFAKIRSYGLLSPSQRTRLERARLLLDHHAAAISHPREAPTENPAAPAAPATTCPPPLAVRSATARSGAYSNAAAPHAHLNELPGAFLPPSTVRATDARLDRSARLPGLVLRPFHPQGEPPHAARVSFTSTQLAPGSFPLNATRRRTLD